MERGEGHGTTGIETGVMRPQRGKVKSNEEPEEGNN